MGIPVKPKNFTYKYTSPDKVFSLNLTFNKDDISPDEVINALKEACEAVKS
jgi:hypothetical protein